MTFSLPGSLQSLSRLVLGQNIVSHVSNFVPRKLYISRLAESRTDSQTQEVYVADLRWHQMDHTMAVDALEKILIPLIGALKRDAQMCLSLPS
jgi:hypothetical protein